MTERTELEALRDALPAIQALLDGKRVRCVVGQSKGNYERVCNVPWGSPFFRWEIEPDTIRPFTPEEAVKHLGRGLYRKRDAETYTFYKSPENIGSISEHHVVIYSMTCGKISVKYADLAKDWTFEDGSPCGIVE